MSFFSTSTTLELEPPDFRSDDLTQRSEQLRALLFVSSSSDRTALDAQRGSHDRR